MSHKKYNFSVNDVSEVYAGPGGKLWELLMGEQIHVGGEEQTDLLASKLGIEKDKNSYLLDICSALGGPARHLAEIYNVNVVGLDITPEMLNEAIKRTTGKSYEDKIEYRLGSALDIPAHSNIFDIVWGQDAWCYIRDKERLIQEAFRVLKNDGKIGFTDWIWGPNFAPESIADHLMEFMVFPDLQTLDGYGKLLEKVGFTLQEKQDYGIEFAKYMNIYVDILRSNRSNIVEGFGKELYIEAEKGVVAWKEAAHEKWVSRGLWIAQK